MLAVMKHFRLRGVTVAPLPEGQRAAMISVPTYFQAQSLTDARKLVQNAATLPLERIDLDEWNEDHGWVDADSGPGVIIESKTRGP
jgi:hypothetical protein